MQRSLSLIVLIMIFGFSIVSLGISPQTARAYQYSSLQQQRQIELSRIGAKPTYIWRSYGKVKRLITYATPIQHIVVIDMENRTVDNLFSGYYGLPFRGGPQTWNQVMNIWNPSNPAQPLTAIPLEAQFDPHHSHINFDLESTCGFGPGCETFSCPTFGCPLGHTGNAYVPISETSPYAQLVQNYASADDVYQANEGPSMPSHQYLIAGQSGGILNSLTFPLAVASNPKPSPEPIGDDSETGPPDDAPVDYCSTQQVTAPSLDMTQHWPESTDGNMRIVPCESYTNGTILDEIAASQGTPTYFDWQYIAHQDGGYWAAPTAVENLWASWNANKSDPTQPFAVDKNAYNFVQNLLTGSGMPTRPFAALTYITPCPNASDHADTTGDNINGPKWLGAVINAIGTAQNGEYWPNTLIVVTWDDWGGWFDHMPRVPAFPNAYKDLNNPPPNHADPNEWGFRVPLLVISPYVRSAGYVSHGPATTIKPRSQSAILKMIETLFTLPSLQADDSFSNDDLMDTLNFNNNNFHQFIPVNVGNYVIPQGCQT